MYIPAEDRNAPRFPGRFTSARRDGQHSTSVLLHAVALKTPTTKELLVHPVQASLQKMRAQFLLSGHPYLTLV